MSEKVCSSAAMLNVYIKEAQKKGLVPREMSEFEDGTLVSEAECASCGAGSCQNNPKHKSWKKDWRQKGSPIPDEVINRGNKPHF